MERSIQQACTNRSRAWPQFAWDSESQRKNVSSDYSVLKARPSKKHWTKYNRYVILGQSDRSVSMTVRFHLFPFRTQKLSSLVPKIVRWKRRVKIGSRRLEQKTLQKKFWGVFLLQSASEDVSGAFLLLPEETAGNDAIFQHLPNTSGNKRLNRKHFNNSTKNSNLFSAKMPLDMLY